MHRAVATHPLANPVQRFTDQLTSWRSPAFLAPLGHRLGPAEPAGTAALARPVAAQRAADLPVQRSRPGAPTPGAAAAGPVLSWSTDTAVHPAASASEAGGSDDPITRAGVSEHALVVPARPVQRLTPLTTAPPVAQPIPRLPAVARPVPPAAPTDITADSTVAVSHEQAQAPVLAPPHDVPTVGEAAPAAPIAPVPPGEPTPPGISTAEPHPAVQRAIARHPPAGAQPPLPRRLGLGAPRLPESPRPVQAARRASDRTPPIHPAPAAGVSPERATPDGAKAPLLGLDGLKEPAAPPALQAADPAPAAPVAASEPLPVPARSIAVQPAVETPDAPDVRVVAAPDSAAVSPPEPAAEAASDVRLPTSRPIDVPLIGAPLAPVQRAETPPPVREPKGVADIPVVSREPFGSSGAVPAAAPATPEPRGRTTASDGAAAPVVVSRLTGYRTLIARGAGDDPWQPRGGEPAAASGTQPGPGAAATAVRLLRPPAVQRAASSPASATVVASRHAFVGASHRQPTGAVASMSRHLAAGEMRLAQPVITAPEMPPARLIAAPVSGTVQRQNAAEEPSPEPAATAAQDPAAAPATAVAPAAVSAGAASAESPDELVKKLFDPLLRRLKTELRLDRERRGLLTDRHR